MTETKTVILVAWDNETEHSLSDADKQRLDDNNIEIVYTGIGKINATRAITDLCVRNEYEFVQPLRRKKNLHIVNVGCAGSHTTGVRTLIKPNAFIQRDMDARQFNYERYRTPEQVKWIIRRGDDLDHDLAKTQRSSVLPEIMPTATPKHQKKSQPLTLWTWRLTLLHVCAYYGVKFTCYKWITDLAAEDSTIEELTENNKLLHGLKLSMKSLLK